MRELDLAGVPVTFDHASGGGFRVGRVERSWIDDEGWMRMSGIVDADTLSGRAVVAQIERGTRTGLSVTHDYELMSRVTREPGYFEIKDVVEVAILPEDRAERAGCLISGGEMLEIEDRRDSITGTPEEPRQRPSEPEMDPKEKAAWEVELAKEREKSKAVAEDLEKFTIAARVKEQKMEEMQKQLEEKDAAATAYQTQLKAFFDGQNAAVEAKQQEVAGMTRNPEEAQAAFEELREGLPTEKLGALHRVYTLVSDNMRVPTRDESEAMVQGFKQQLTYDNTVEGMRDENRKRFRDETGTSRATAGSSRTVSARQLAVLAQVEAEMKRKGL